MANHEHVAILKRGVEAWNTWRREHPKVQPDLSGTHLQGADLSSIDLSGASLQRIHLNRADLNFADLRRVDLRESSCYGADLRGTDLSGSDLSGANLGAADIREANLSHALLRGTNIGGAHLGNANLDEAVLCRADLRDANLSGVSLQGTMLHHIKVYGTIFAQIDLSRAKGLTHVNHQGPSSLDLSTVKLPQDGSLQVFLRGVGIPDEWIDFYRAQMMFPIVYHSCFISYSHQDEDLATRFHNDLQGAGVRCWFAPHDLKIGDKYRDRIDQAIHMQEKLLLLLSEAAIASDWVESEVEIALEKEHRQKREILFPVRLDDTVMHTTEAWAANIRQKRHIGDFTHWKDHEMYKKAFKRLLRDLKKT